MLSKYDESKIPDVILLDINMPVWDGWQFLEQLNLITMRKQVQLFMVSSSMKDEDKAKAESYEKVGSYFMKPVSTIQLKEMMKAA